MGAQCSTPKEQHTNGSEAMEMYLASPNTKEANTRDTKREQVLTPWNDCDRKTENTSLGKETGKLERLGAADASVRCGGYCRK